MHRFAFLSAFLLCLFASGAAAAMDCTESKSHVEGRICLEALAIKTNLEMERLEGQLRSRIKLWDQDPASIQHSLVMFDQERQAYRRYREARCEFDASAAAGGNGAGDMRLRCMANLDGQRIENLNIRLEWIEPED